MPRSPQPLPPVTQPAKHYVAHKAMRPITIDGQLNEADWKRAPWTDYFVDIEGPDKKPNPKFKTRAKMLWDDKYLYIAAELEEPDVKALLTKHDSVIFHDNDFEIFIKPVAGEQGYFEFEMNALNTGWDLYLTKPYREGGKADNSWEIDGLMTAVSVQGTLNQSNNTDKGWTVEVAYPWRAFLSRQPNVPAPKAGTDWMIDFSRVEWTAGKPKEDNWVWSPQGVINMHVPERWGHVTFAR